MTCGLRLNSKRIVGKKKRLVPSQEERRQFHTQGGPSFPGLLVVINRSAHWPYFHTNRKEKKI